MTSEEPQASAGTPPDRAVAAIEAAIFASVGLFFLASAVLDFVYFWARTIGMETTPRGMSKFSLDEIGYFVWNLVELLLGVALTFGAPRLVRLWSRWTGVHRSLGAD